jgi:hypothetical protein
MMRFMAVALTLLGLAHPVWAQRGGSHGSSGHGGFSSHAGFSSPGFSSRGTAAFHSGQGVSGFRTTGPAHFSYPPRFVGGRVPAYGRSFSSQTFANRNARPEYRSSPQYGQHRPPYRSPYRNPYRYGFPFGSGWGGWYGPSLLWYPDDFDYGSGYDDSQAITPYYPQQDFDPQYSEPYPSGPNQSEARPPYSGSSPSSQSLRTEPAGSPITLVFKDGRPSEQVRNFILSRDTVSVWDQGHREIPVDQLDLAATEKLNRDAGVDFRLPDAVR